MVRWADYQGAVFVVLALGSIASEQFLWLAVPGAAVLFAIRWRFGGRPLPATAIDLPVLVLVLGLPLTLFVSPVPLITLPQVGRLLVGIGLCYALVDWIDSQRRLFWSLAALALLAGGLALLAPFSVRWTPDKLPFLPPQLYFRFTQLVEERIHPNVAAGYLALLWPCALAVLAWLVARRQWPGAVIAGVGVVGIAGMVLLTQSRGALLAFGSMLVGMSVLLWHHRWLVIVASGLVGGGAALVLRERTQAIIDYLVRQPVVLERWDIWSRAVQIIQDVPLTGIGMGAFGPVVDTFYPLSRFPPDTIPHAHQLFLQIGVDLGIPGLVAWLAIAATVLVAAGRVFASPAAAHQPGGAWVGAALMGSQVVLLVHGLTDAVTWGMVQPAPLVWALWGVILAAERLSTSAPSHGVPCCVKSASNASFGERRFRFKMPNPFA